MTKSRVKFNQAMNSSELRVDECSPDLPAYLVEATEILSKAYYGEGISKSDYHEGKKRIDNLTRRFFKECLCRNIRR